MNDNYMIEDLLVKHLLGETNAQEDKYVQDWLEAAAENKKHFAQLKLIWNSSKKFTAETTIDENDAWQRLQQRIAYEEAGKKKTIVFKPSYIRIAAGLLLLIAIGWSYFTWNRSPEMLVVQSQEEVLTQTLPDGSVVTLNKNSSVQYPEEFKGNERNVQLSGEAFFDVAPDKSKPFIIAANQSRIKVVGTSFNVRSSAERTEVIVATGVVEVSKNENSVVLNPNESAVVWADRNDPVKQKNEDQLYNYYRTKEFVCNGTPLYRLVDVLNQAYGKNIVIANNKLSNLPLTATFHDESLEKILLVIGETFNITVERDQNQIRLK
ncbi:MAG TPA: FecR domain-containing protein [Flavipsychrobacter sp.]|nr:FecR domain-containing protein [Flavipsychrobacter sp.]